MQTSYFTFGQAHRHKIKGHYLNADTVLKLTAPDPRSVMFLLCGDQWSHEYPQIPDMTFLNIVIDLHGHDLVEVIESHLQNSFQFLANLFHSTKFDITFRQTSPLHLTVHRERDILVGPISKILERLILTDISDKINQH